MTPRPNVSIALLLAALAATAAGAKPLPNGTEVRSNGVTLRVEALSDSILRVREWRGAQMPEDASWAVPVTVRHREVAVRQTSDGFQTRSVAVHIDPQSLRLAISNLRGQTISEDGADPVRFDGQRFSLRKLLPIGAHIYGMGDKTGEFDRRGQSFVNWDTDAYGFQRDTDPIYKSIPFYIAAGGDGGAYGLFVDNTWRSWFDFGHRDAGAIEIGAEGGPIDYYIIAGPTVRDVVCGYAGLTGKAPLPPLWSLGFQQLRVGYVSADEVRSIAARLRKDRI